MHSDSIVRGNSFPGERSWDSRNPSLLDFDDTQPKSITEGLLGTSELGSSLIAFHAHHLTTTTLLLSKKRRSSSTKKVENTANTTMSHVTGSVLATLSPTNNATGELLSANDRVMPLKYSSGRQPSPKTLNAANMIVTALRPAPAQTQPMLPKPSCIAGQSDNYYWNQGSGNVEMCEIQEQQTGIPTPAQTQPMLPKPSCIAGQSDNYYWNQDSGNAEMCDIQEEETGIPRTWSSESFDDSFFQSKSRETQSGNK